MTYKKIGKMGFHALMNHTELSTQPLDIILDVRLQAFQIQTMLVQRMQDLFLARESLRRAFLICLWRRLLMKTLDRSRQFREVLRSQVRHGIESGRLEIFKAGMIEHLANGPLQRLPA